MANEKPKTETFHVYGKDIVVELDIEYDASLNILTLKPGQIQLRDNLFLMEYIEAKSLGKQEGDKWMYGILHEIIHLHCRTDPDVILSKACPNFEEYLINLAQEMAKVKAIPYVNDKRINSKKRINENIKSKKATNSKKEATQYGTITLIFTVSFQDIINEITGDSVVNAAAATPVEGEKEKEGEEVEGEEEEGEEGEEEEEIPVPPELDYIKKIYEIYTAFTKKLKTDQASLAKMANFTDTIPPIVPDGYEIRKQYKALINRT
jgi:hypothetical protein